MRSEPLKIHDEKFLINRLIQQAPTGTLIREFFKNADESAALAPEGQRLIKIYPVEIEGVSKLAFWNTGIGMDAKELKQATELSSSINKKMSLDGNFGIGAKVSGLTISQAGIRYRSCKDGCVHEVTIGYEEEEGTYVRFVATLPDGTQETIYDVTETVRREGKDLDYDWTEVVLFGESDDHNTVSEPLGRGKRVDRSFVTTNIFRRFASFSEGVDVKIDVAMTKGGGKEETGYFRRLKTLDQIVDKLPRHQTVNEPDDDIAIHYIYDPKHGSSSHSLSARANPATGSTTFCAIVHKGERYDFKTGKAWSSAAPNFGIPFGSKVLTIEILIPDSMALPNQYRDGLTWPVDRSAMTAEYFDYFVRELMPDWVKEIIRAESPEATDNLDDLQKDLQQLLDEFRIPTVAKQLRKSPDSEKSEIDDDGVDLTDPASVSFGDFPEDLDLQNNSGECQDQAGRRAKQKKVRKAPEGAKTSGSEKALERVPEIKILIDLEEINEKNLKGRAGRYYKDVHILFINGLYPVVERMALDLEREMAGMGEPEVIRETVLNTSRRFMAFRVGKATCYAISKRMSEDWSSDDLEKATSPESLSMAADDFKQSLSSAKKVARDMIKAAEVRVDAA